MEEASGDCGKKSSKPAPAKESRSEVVRLGPLKPKAWVLYELDRAKCKSRDITKNEILFAQLQIQRSERNDPNPKSIAGSWTTIVTSSARTSRGRKFPKG